MIEIITSHPVLKNVPAHVFEPLTGILHSLSAMDNSEKLRLMLAIQPGISSKASSLCVTVLLTQQAGTPRDRTLFTHRHRPVNVFDTMELGNALQTIFQTWSEALRETLSCKQFFLWANEQMASPNNPICTQCEAFRLSACILHNSIEISLVCSRTAEVIHQLEREVNPSRSDPQPWAYSKAWQHPPLFSASTPAVGPRWESFAENLIEKCRNEEISRWQC